MTQTRKHILASAAALIFDNRVPGPAGTGSVT